MKAGQEGENRVRNPVAQRVFNGLEAKILELGIELVDVEFVRERSARILRLVIDKQGGVDHEDCSRVSRLADPLIDHDLQIQDHDYLEVSSPGLERPLKTDRDFQRYLGEWVEVTLYQAIEGKKEFVGRLLPTTAETIAIEPEKMPARQFPKQQVARVRRTLVF
jgi:ribosome maturation factor RimP